MSDASDIPWFKVYAAETLSDERIMGWTCEELGAFFKLLCLQWREGSIPSEPDALRRFLHLDGPAFSVVWQTIGNRFAPSDAAPGRLSNVRMEQERQTALMSVRQHSDAGRKGANSRWGKGKSANGDRMRSPKRPHCDSPDSPMQEEKEKERRSDQQQRRGGLPTETELVGGQHPGSSALRLRLREEGLDLAFPAADKRTAVEDAVARCGVESCVSACLADAARMRERPKSLGIFAATLARLQPAASAPISPWWARMTPDARERFERERHAIDPELDGGPYQATGARHTEAMRALIARFEMEARQ